MKISYFFLVFISLVLFSCKKNECFCEYVVDTTATHIETGQWVNIETRDTLPDCFPESFTVTIDTIGAVRKLKKRYVVCH